MALASTNERNAQSARGLTYAAPRSAWPRRPHTRLHLAVATGFIYAATVSHAWYFAYGSNMQTATFCGRRGIEFVRARAARVPGWRLVLDKPPLLPIGESFANIVPDPTSAVLGVAYEISADALASIDLTEGVLIGNYQRWVVAAELLDATPARVDAFTLMSERRDPALIPSTRYMALLIDGALEHGLPAEYVDFLRSLPARPPSLSADALQPWIDEAMAALRPKPRRE
jgi:gamma-glutamylcyclotransferase